jgi:hypothetical protein
MSACVLQMVLITVKSFFLIVAIGKGVIVCAVLLPVYSYIQK